VECGEGLRENGLLIQTGSEDRLRLPGGVDPNRPETLPPPREQAAVAQEFRPTTRLSGPLNQEIRGLHENLQNYGEEGVAKANAITAAMSRLDRSDTPENRRALQRAVNEGLALDDRNRIASSQSQLPDLGVTISRRLNDQGRIEHTFQNNGSADVTISVRAGNTAEPVTFTVPRGGSHTHLTDRTTCVINLEATERATAAGADSRTARPPGENVTWDEKARVWRSGDGYTWDDKKRVWYKNEVLDWSRAEVLRESRPASHAAQQTPPTTRTFTIVASETYTPPQPAQIAVPGRTTTTETMDRTRRDQPGIHRTDRPQPGITSTDRPPQGPGIARPTDERPGFVVEAPRQGQLGVERVPPK
jgi:hypothetical protein